MGGLEGLALFFKQIKDTMRFQTKLFQKQDSKKVKRVENLLKEKDKSTSKEKTIECYNYDGLGHL